MDITTQAIDMSTDELRTVRKLLDLYLPDTPAWVYGSRVKRISNSKSDLDLVVFATPEQRPQVHDLREAFEESDLLFRVDLFLWDDLPQAFKKQIKERHVALR